MTFQTINNTKKAFLLGAMVCALGMMSACKNDNSKGKRFFPIFDSGYTYAYISAETYGLSGGHERIMIQKDTNNIDSNYCFYGNELFIAPSADILQVYVLNSFVKKDADLSDSDIDVIVLTQTEYNKLKAEASKRGLTRISVYPPDLPQDTIFLDNNSIPILEQ